MATVLLQSIGATVGSAIGGPIGAIVGRAAGGLAGSLADQQLFSKDRVVTGPQLENAQLLTSTEGTPIPRIYGRNRISGEIIWATRFEEVLNKETTSSGKGGGSKVTTNTYAYFANFAIGLCNGPISGVRRIWADGDELDLTEIEYRVYTGTKTQLPDPLIETKQGVGKVPAYRGTAYVVFESLPLENYGNRVPQISFEVIRPVGRLEKQVRTMTVIPGATEYGYDPVPQEAGGGEAAYNIHNRHSSLSETDWDAAIDELQMVCPNLETIALVVTWYGTDLRAGNCDLKPGVTTTMNSNWQVADFQRHTAHLVSQIDNRAAFGGTPTDVSILRAIADIKARGLKVVFYPFIMMDVPAGNVLPWHGGQTGQPVYPWRGRISCFPAPGENSSVDKTSVARSQLQSFSTQFQTMIRHYISVSAQAGGVDGFLIGSELRGLTRVRDNAGDFPFVETLMGLAAEAKVALGSNCTVSYAADWTEYFGYQPPDGSGDVLFNLDPLWALPSIDCIGIDNYMPLSDWRDGGDVGRSDVFSQYDLDYLKDNIAAQEGYDWYYASQQDREQAIRTPITDGQGEPWVFRYKDIISWWSNTHHNRLGGVRQVSPTSWQPQSKPIWMTELGCPAVDKGANQPNVFFDPKSSESFLPYFSSGARDDLMQRRFLEAHFDHWSEVANNPYSSLYNGRMVEMDWTALWAWDARPFPWFPVNLDTWSDGDNWHLGHWLIGRFGGCSLNDLVTQILIDFGETEFEVKLNGLVEGHIVPGSISARETLDPLLSLFDIDVWEEGGRLVFCNHSFADRKMLDDDDLIQDANTPLKSRRRSSETELPSEVVIRHLSSLSDFEDKGTKSRRVEGGSDRQITFQMQTAMPESTAVDLANMHLQKAWFGREEINVMLGSKHLGLSAGDVINIPPSTDQKWQVESIETGISQSVSLRSISTFSNSGISRPIESGRITPRVFFGKPLTLFLDLPVLRDADAGKNLLHFAITANPWAGFYDFYSSPSENGFVFRAQANLPATIGKLLSPLSPGPTGRWDRKNSLHINLINGSLSSAEQLKVLNSENVLGVQSSLGSMEVLQFENAELQSDGTWILRNLLRGQLGTEQEMNAGALDGAWIVLIDEALLPVEMDGNERGVAMNWRVGPANRTLSSNHYFGTSYTYSALSRRMYSVVHVNCQKMANEDKYISWKRRGRFDADSWENAEIPLDADTQVYRLMFRTLANNIVREVETNSPNYNYSAAQQTTDLGSSDTPFKVAIVQIGNDGLPGSETVFVST